MRSGRIWELQKGQHCWRRKFGRSSASDGCARVNAGISKAATIKDHTVEDFDNLFATNVRSPFFLVQQLLPILGDGSNIIVVSSIAAHAVVGKPGLDNPSLLAYASTKGALRLWSRTGLPFLGLEGSA
jgi:3-oxoacyl-[acyl-carrier protein] reductase